MNIEDPAKPFYVFRTCEDKYEYFDFIMEFWAVITSLFYAFPYIFVRLSLKKYCTETYIVCKFLVVVSFLSSLYHIYPCMLTQFLDQVGIVAVLYTFINLNKIPVSKAEKIVTFVFFCLGPVHAFFMACCLIMLFVRLLGFLLKFGIRIKRIQVLNTIVTLGLAGGFLLADIFLCQYEVFEHFHSLWHIGTQFGFVFGIVEMEFFQQNYKDVIPLKNGCLDL